MNTGSLIALRNLSVVYPEGDHAMRALDTITLDIYPEEYVIFFGPSGCGKSTLLYTVAGLERPTEGEVLVGGRNLAAFTNADIVELHRRTVGMIFQAYYLISSLSVRANVALPQIFLGTPKAERIEYAERLLERFGIISQKGKVPTSLSGGQQQRVAICRSLMNNPPILLADEPVGNLDSKSAEEVMKLLLELNEKDKRTVVLVTHNPAHLIYGHRIFYMRDGKIIQEVRNDRRAQVRQDTVKPFRAEGLGEMLRETPHLDESDLKARLLVRYLTDQVDVDVEYNLMALLKRFLRGDIDRPTFVAIVSEPLRTGGIGLYRPRAERLADDVTAVIGMSKYLKSHFGDFPRNYEKYQELLERVSRYLILPSSAHFSEETTARLQSAIKGRLEGSLNKASFTDFLDLSHDEGGAGLNIRTAHTMARYLDLILIDYSLLLPQTHASS